MSRANDILCKRWRRCLLLHRMGLRLRSLLIVRVLPSMVGVGVALNLMRRFVRCMRQDCRLIRIA